MTTDSGLRILIVEDDLVDRRMLERLLSQSVLDIAVQQAAGDLKTAKQLLQTETYDIILTDLDLPDSSGIDAIGELNHSAPDVPLIVLSGLDD
ncbi:MAG: response regulator, partial [Planctomycetes bacterium]|nr:response regulator [Planctomycetota bacterium]